MRRLVPLAAALLAATAGCSSSAAAPTAGTSPTPSAGQSSAPPADGGSYANADAILAALKAAGSPCTNPSPVANPIAPGALSMIGCAGVGDGDTAVVVFDSAEHAASYASELTTGPLANMLPGAVVVYGRNWTVNTVPEYEPQVQRILGGQILTGPSASPS